MRQIKIIKSPWEIEPNSQSNRPSYKNMTLRGFTIRPATADDALNLINFYEDHRDPGVTIRDTEKDPMTYEKHLKNHPDKSFIAVQGDQIIAALLGEAAVGRGMFRHLLVAREHRGQGIAKLLVDAGLNAFAKERVGLVQAIVSINNDDAKTFWEKMGFRFSSSPDAASNGKIVLMSIDLPVAKYIDRRDKFISTTQQKISVWDSKNSI